MALSEMPPPSDERAEGVLLGALIRDNGSISETGHLRPHHFSDPVHNKVFCEIDTRLKTGQGADLDSLRNSPALGLALEEAGGTDYLAQLAQLPPPDSVPRLAQQIVDLWQRRELIEVYRAQIADAEEAIANLQGLTSRAPAQVLVQTAAGRAATVYGVAKALMDESHPLFAGGPGDAVKLVGMLPLEIAELAVNHERLAVAAEDQGDFCTSTLRRSRIEQLRAMIGEVQP